MPGKGGEFLGGIEVSPPCWGPCSYRGALALCDILVHVGWRDKLNEVFHVW